MSTTTQSTGNIAAALADMASQRPYALAVACPAGRDRAGRATYTPWTFQQLHRASDTLARGLVAHGIGRGVRTVLMVKPSLEFFALTFALFKAGAVPVLIDPGMGIKNLGRCLAEAEPTAFLGIPQAQLARRVLGWAKATIAISVTVSHRAKPRANPSPLQLTLADLTASGQSDEPFPIAPTTTDDLAAILFTSGSTGPPKGAVYTHGIFLAQVEMLRALYGIAPGEIDLCTFPLFALFAPALGMTSIVPEMDATRPARVDPTRIIDAIETFGATNMFGSPALIRRVAEYGAARGVVLPSLRRAISAGAPVPASVLERFASMLGPGVEIFTPYGATESLPVASLGSATILEETRAKTDQGAGVCVGPPVPGMRAEIIAISDKPIPRWSDDLLVPEGTIGEIVVRGPVVTQSYFHRPEADALAKIADDGPAWHRMGDLGYRDSQGRLWFCGRKAHRVVTPTETLYTIPCEAVFNVHPDVNRSALVGIGPRGQARPVLCVEPATWPLSRDTRDRLRRELLDIAAAHDHTRLITTVLFHRSFPVDIRHNAKIFREKLALWAARRTYSP